MKLIIAAFLLGSAFAIIVESKPVDRSTRQLGDDGIYFSDDGYADNENQMTQEATKSAYDGYGRTTKTTTTTTQVAPVNNQAALQRCMRACLTTSEHNPLCATNRQTYNNIGQLTCAQNCGLDIQILFRGVCSA